MLEAFDVLREIAQVVKWTGLSAGVVLALVALGYFFPFARSFAVVVGLCVLCAYGAGIYCFNKGRADVQAQWNTANAAAAAAAKARDVSIEAELEREFQATKVSPDDTNILAALSAAAASSCQLGPVALRLRQHK